MNERAVNSKSGTVEVMHQRLMETMEGYLHRLMVERAELRRELRELDVEISAVERNIHEMKTKWIEA